MWRTLKDPGISLGWRRTLHSLWAEESYYIIELLEGYTTVWCFDEGWWQSLVRMRENLWRMQKVFCKAINKVFVIKKQEKLSAHSEELVKYLTRKWEAEVGGTVWKERHSNGNIETEVWMCRCLMGQKIWGIDHRSYLGHSRCKSLFT